VVAEVGVEMRVVDVGGVGAECNKGAADWLADDEDFECS